MIKSPILNRRNPVAAPTSVGLFDGTDNRREEAERFIYETFRQAYGARVDQFMPMLLGLRDDAGRLQGVLGLRDAVSERLYLERYLTAPVEEVLSAAVAEPVARRDVVEMGNLAISSAGGGRWLIKAMTAFMHASGKQWCVFTCGRRLRNVFSKFGLELIDLGEATADCLSDDELSRWGSYYDQSPHVMAGNIRQGFETLSAMFETECAQTVLWRCAAKVGGQSSWA